MALGCSAPNAIRLVELAIAVDGLDWPAAPCRPWLSRQATGSTLGAENRVKDTGEEGNRSLGKVLQCSVRYNVRNQSLADLKTPDGFLNLVRGG